MHTKLNIFCIGYLAENLVWRESSYMRVSTRYLLALNSWASLVLLFFSAWTHLYGLRIHSSQVVVRWQHFLHGLTIVTRWVGLIPLYLPLVKLISIEYLNRISWEVRPVISTRSVCRGICVNTESVWAGSGSHPAYCSLGTGFPSGG